MKQFNVKKSNKYSHSHRSKLGHPLRILIELILADGLGNIFYCVLKVDHRQRDIHIFLHASDLEYVNTLRQLAA